MPENTDTPPIQHEVRLKIENSVKLDPQHPIPIQYRGQTLYAVTGKGYVPFLGKDDNLPTLLLEARLTSATQNACITSIANSTIGNGLIVLDVEKPNPDFIEWTKSVNSARQSFNEVLLNVVDGERTTGNQFIEVTRGEFNKKRFFKLFLHPTQYCRLSEPGEKDNDIAKSVIISKLFAKKGLNRNDIKQSRVIPLWSDNAIDQKTCWLNNPDGTQSTMVHFKNEVQGIDHYGLPASVAGLRYQVLEGSSAQYNIDNFENNMVLGGMLIFKSAMTEEEANRNAKRILLSHIGEGKTGRIAVLSSESGLTDIDWKPYDTQKEGSYIELDKRIEEKIIAANGWDSTLAGINTNNKMGNSSIYIRSIYDVKEAVLLNPLRRKLIDKVVSPIMKVYAEWMKNTDVSKYNFSFKTAMPFSFMADIVPDNFMKVNEARALAGLAPDDSMNDVYLAEMKAKGNNNNVQTKPDTPEGNNSN